MEQVNKKVLKAVERVVRYEVDHKRSPWICIGIFHQPKRPIARKENN